MHILIFGASGHVGTALAKHLGDGDIGGHRISGVVRSQPDGPVPYEPIVLPDWVDDPDKAAEAIRTRSGPPVDAVIAAVGGWYVDEAMLERGIESFDADYGSYLRGHFSACAVSKLLSEAGKTRIVHLALNGVASVEACIGSGAISVFGAAQNMLLRVAEAETDAVDFRELRVIAPIDGDDRNDLTGGVETIGIAEVAASAARIISNPGDVELSSEISPE
ncbi:NAD(P)-dependent oxidoreductase [Brevibacterium oceani]|uniref:NAD(P)-dependent oxidoreductase n=1 Tax=Brevibacterium oceani TaxID=358099 RepID=UPI0015E6C1A9|nr:NAD(P)-dependent oxidoreductase [Brevibacterium oceani]